MTPALTAWDTIWQGCAAYAIAGATVVHRDRIRWFATGVGYEGLNGVFIAPGTPAVPVEDALRTFHDLRVPALWHVAATGQPMPIADLPGVSWYEEEPLMVAPVGRYEMPHVPRLSVYMVRDEAGIREWVRIWSGQGSGSVFDGLVAARSAAGPAFTHLLAVVAGTPVACAAAFVGDSAGEVQHVVTVPGMRRRGIGTALVVAALRAIGEHGRDVAVLTSSRDGLGLYRRLGFRPVGAVARYLWAPPSVQNPAEVTRPDGVGNIIGSPSDVGVRGGYPARAWVQRPAMPS
jgi:ribosomal protein S18 acetylase RimI-like enzyme